MKINDILLEKTKYEIFCDLDGVLVDFDGQVARIFHIKPGKVPEFMNGPKAHARINGYIKKGNKFFETMHPMPDMKELWDYIKKYNPTILSSKGAFTNAEKEKRIWVGDHLGEDTEKHTILVNNSKAKAQYAGENKVLIDDREKSLGPWREAGGIAIKHTSAKDTIAQLKELGL